MKRPHTINCAKYSNGHLPCTCGPKPTTKDRWISLTLPMVVALLTLLNFLLKR